MGWSSLVRIPSLRRSLCHRATSDRNVIDVLTERGLVDNVNGIEQLRKAAVRDEIDNATTSRKPLSVYCGFDPTADALHLGNYVGLVVLEWFQKFGHRAVAVIGGATGRIGDPSGKSEERPVLKHDTVDENARKLKASIEDYLGPSATVLNNYEWIGGMSYLDFLGTVGRHARVGTMLGKESVRSRLQSSVGISFTEFSYQLLQAYDFAHLCQAHDVTVQIGGSDQLGNMQAGVDLARKIKPSGPHLHTLTFPLLTTSDGKKYGKSEKGAIWIDPDRLSPYGLYQFLLRTRDEDVIKLLKTITFLPIEQVEQLEASMASTDYKANSAQRLLAETITRDVHGIDGLKSAQVATKILLPGSKSVVAVTASDLRLLAKELPSRIVKPRIIGKPLNFLLTKAKLGTPKEAHRLIEGGHVVINSERITSKTRLVKESDFLDGDIMLISVGKKKKLIVHLKEAEEDPPSLKDEIPKEEEAK